MWKVYIEYRVADDQEQAFRAVLPSLRKEMEELPGGPVSQWSLWEGWDQPNLFVEEVLCLSLRAAQEVAATVSPQDGADGTTGGGRSAPGSRGTAEAGVPGDGVHPAQLHTLRQWATRRESLGAHRFHVWIFEQR